MKKRVCAPTISAKMTFSKSFFNRILTQIVDLNRPKPFYDKFINVQCLLQTGYIVAVNNTNLQYTYTYTR